MNKVFYPKLAVSNIKKNSKTYIPFILTSIGTIIMFYIMCELSVNKGFDKMPNFAALKTILGLGTYVIAIFSFIFLFYTNSFLIKQRKKEFGLFNILGMEKKHISRIILFETLIIFMISIVVGMFGGILFSKLMYLFLLYILNFDAKFGFDISTHAVFSTVILFSAIFFLIFLNNLRQIYLSKPIELLKGGQVGEREPKTKWLLTMIGVITLGGGYYIAQTTESPLAALNLFFVAVILVIIGTYCLFTAGSITFLKFLRKNKKYYYKTKHFTSVSGMMYRMKQNAVGLANICILSTAVLVMLSTTISLYAGMEDVLSMTYRRNIMISSTDITEDYINKLHNTINGIIDDNDVKVENVLEFRGIQFYTKQKGESLNINNIEEIYANDINMKEIYLVPLEDYNAINNTSLTLNEDEVLLYSNANTYKGDSISLFNHTFKVKEVLNTFTGNKKDTVAIVDAYYVIFKNISIVEKLMNKQIQAEGNEDNTFTHCLGFDLNVDDEKCLTITNDIRSALENNSLDSTSIRSSAGAKEALYSIYGALLFLGIFLGALFLMATALIIYYKQISEGYDDKERFHIMQKVGMSHAEIRKSIHSQVVTVFFLPIIAAGIHLAFAFKVITKMLIVLNLYNITLFAWCTVFTILIFAVIYAIIYALTARVYYKIVS